MFENIQLAWIDYTAIAILLVFVILGFFRGLLWQISRLASLVVSFWLSGLYAGRLAAFVENDLGWFSGDLAIYASYFAIFVACLVVLSLVTILLDKLLKRLELKYYDYLGGGVLGLVTGTAIVIALLGALFAFSSKEGSLFQTVHASETARVSRVIVSKLDPWLPENLKSLFLTVPPRAEKPGANEAASQDKSDHDPDAQDPDAAEKNDSQDK